LLRTVYLNADIHCQDSLLSEGLGPPNERVSFGSYIIVLFDKVYFFLVAFYTRQVKNTIWLVYYRSYRR